MLDEVPVAFVIAAPGLPESGAGGLSELHHRRMQVQARRLQGAARGVRGGRHAARNPGENQQSRAAQTFACSGLVTCRLISLRWRNSEASCRVFKSDRWENISTCSLSMPSLLDYYPKHHCGMACGSGSLGKRPHSELQAQQTPMARLTVNRWPIS